MEHDIDTAELQDIILKKIRTLRHKKFTDKRPEELSVIVRVFLMKYLGLHYEFTSEELSAELAKRRIRPTIKESILRIFAALGEVMYGGKGISRQEFRSLLDDFTMLVHLATDRPHSHQVVHQKATAVLSGLIALIQKMLTPPESPRRNDGASVALRPRVVKKKSKKRKNNR